jgi:hypothetical protein
MEPLQIWSKVLLVSLMSGVNPHAQHEPRRVVKPLPRFNRHLQPASTDRACALGQLLVVKEPAVVEKPC